MTFFTLETPLKLVVGLATQRRTWLVTSAAENSFTPKSQATSAAMARMSKFLQEVCVVQLIVGVM